MVLWLNRSAADQPRNGTTAHTVSFAAASVGNLLVAVVDGGVTSTTPTGWTLPTNGSSVLNVGHYVWWKTATAGESSFSTTHNSSNYPVYTVVYEFPSGSTFGAAATSGATGQAVGAANPTITPTAGQLAFATASYTAASNRTTGTWSWSAGPTEDIDVFIPFSATDGYFFSVAYLEDAPATAFAPTATPAGSPAPSAAEKQLVSFTVNVAAAATTTLAKQTHASRARFRASLW